jgi:hypothetical protein
MENKMNIYMLINWEDRTYEGYATKEKAAKALSEVNVSSCYPDDALENNALVMLNIETDTLSLSELEIGLGLHIVE